jgi:cell division protein FtsL
MPDNRRRHSSNTVPTAKIFAVSLILAALCISGIFYLWKKNQMITTGLEITKRESELRSLKRQNESATTEISQLTSTVALEKSQQANRFQLKPITPVDLFNIEANPPTSQSASLRPVANERKQE